MAPPHLPVNIMTARNIPNILSIHNILLPVRYPAAFFTQLLLLPTRACFFAASPNSPGVPVAFVAVAFHAHPQSTAPHPLPSPAVEILTLGVLPAFQHAGLARRLVLHACRYLRTRFPHHLPADRDQPVSVLAHVSTTNTPALKFYESLGMRSVATIPGLYRTLPHGSRNAYLVVGQLTL